MKISRNAMFREVIAQLSDCRTDGLVQETFDIQSVQ